MDSNYKFINLVDPSRCSAKIKDKFAKLTLSSNKKKQDESEMPQEVHEKIVSKRISRNLLSELLTDDESDKDEKDKSQGNLLMRTDSSPLSIANRQLGNPELHDVTGTTHCSQIECDAPEKSLEMEPLVYSFTENTQQLDEEIEKLSSRVSSLAVNNGQPIRINSEVNPHEVSRLVSTDHQRIGIGQVSSPVKLRAELKKEPDISICISSDDDDDTKSESDAPITITDSSEAEDEIEPLKAQPEEEHEPNVSSIVVASSSSQSMTTVKANQMAAFLRDVRRNYGLPSATPDRDFERRQHDIATADTEPMTAENDSRSAGTARRIATADTESMTESTEKEPSPNANQSRKLALDDTEDNTRLDDSLHSSRHYNPVVRVAPELLDESVHKSSEPIPDDSLTIAETSEEEDEDPQPAAPPSCGISSALKKSESLSQVQRSSSSMTSSGDTSVQINFSAKINIKIQVSSQQLEDSSSSQSLMDSFQSNDKSTTQSIEEQDVGQSSAQKAAPNQSRAIEDIPHSPPERDVPSEEPLAPPETPAGDFMQKAQQLLNELYGDQWMTPQVLKSLKKVPNSSSSMIAKKKKTPVTKRVPRESEEKPQPKVQKSPMKPAKPSTEPSDDSVLADFSIFRRNIPQDLDSTRLAFPHQSNFKPSNEMTPLSKPKRRQPKPSAPAAKADPPTTVDVTKTRSGREVRQNWRKVVDSDTETEEKEASSDSERSWEKPTKKENIENRKPRTNRGRKQPDAISRLKDDDQIVYLDLTKGEVEIQNNVSSSPPANNDEGFNNRLKEILKSCRYEDKPKLATPGSKSKRKLFSAQINEDFDNIVAPCSDTPRVQKVHADEENVSISGAKMPSKYEPFNKYLESVKRGQPIFKIQTPKANRKDDAVTTPTKTPKSAKKEIRVIDNISDTPRDKYGFLKSLDLCVGKSNCHPDALYYRDNFRLKKEELATKLYEIYNQKCFDNRIDVPLVWNKKLTNTAGRCMNKKRLGERTCVVELSDKVLTSADRLRCTLIHELCHAATWILNGESGHGATWKAWARKANCVFPELPKIGVCHQYEIEYKYTYKCTLCGAKSHAHSKSKKVENIRCSYCHGAIEVYLNKKDKEGNMVMTPVKEPTGFAKFVKDKYKDFKKPDLKHADVMKLLSTEFASMKVDGRP